MNNVRRSLDRQSCSDRSTLYSTIDFETPTGPMIKKTAPIDSSHSPLSVNQITDIYSLY